MKAYKKRLKGNWHQGKRYKGDAEERQFAKREIKTELAAAEEGYLEKYHKGARTKNQRARLEYRIKWYEQALERPRHGSDWWSNYLRSELAKAKKAFEKFEAKEKNK